MKRAVLLLPCLLFATSARAQAPNDHDKAVQLFDDGRRLIEQKDCDTAVMKLDQSLRYEPSVGAHLSMADCLEQNSPLDAWKHLREGQRLAYLKHDDRTKVAADRATALEARLALVHVVIPAAVLQQPSLELRVDGVMVDRFFYDSGVIALPVGPHVIEATTPSQRWSHDVVAQAGATTAVTVSLQPLAVSAGPSAVASGGDERGKGQRMAGLVVSGLGLAGLALGGVFGAAVLVKKSDINTACGGSTTSCTAPAGSLDGAAADQQTFAHISTIGFIAGGVVFVSGVLLFLTAPRGRAVAVTAGFDGHAGSLGVTGRF